MKIKFAVFTALSLLIIPNICIQAWAQDNRNNDPSQQGTQKPQLKIVDCAGKTLAEISHMFDGSPDDYKCADPTKPNPITDQVKRTKKDIEEKAKKVKTDDTSSKNKDEKAKERHGIIAKLEKLPGQVVPKDARGWSIFFGSIIGIATGIVVGGWTGNPAMGFLAGSLAGVAATAGIGHFLKYLKNH